MEFTYILAILGFLYLVYIKIKQMLLTKKSEKQTEELKELKDEAAKKTADANSSYEHTKQLYDKYKAGKSDS